MAGRGVLIAMRRWDKLNERQLSVLQRIGGAGEPVTAASPELAATVYALRNRGLVTTPRKDGVWRAEITGAGRFYLENGRHPDEPGLAGIRVPARPVPGSRGKPAAGAGRSAGPPSGHAAALIEQVRAAGGTLHVPDPDPRTRARYRSALDAAKRSGIVPDGYHLLHTGRD